LELDISNLKYSIDHEDHSEKIKLLKKTVQVLLSDKEKLVT